MAIQHGGFKRKSKVASEIPDSSLADIAFLLLIFFMVTTVFRKEQEREIEMPDAAATSRVDEKRKDIVHLWVEPDGGVFINDARVPTENISDVIQPLFVASERRLVVAIRSDRSVPYNDINEITDELRDAGALRVNFATDFEQRLSAARR
jgi:biopolymer transport protein ExbD